MTHYLLSVHNSYDHNFSSKEFRGIYELKVCITQNKKNFTSVFEQSALKSTSKKRHGFICLLKKETTFLEEKRNIIRIKIYLNQRFSLQFKNKSIDKSFWCKSSSMRSKENASFAEYSLHGSRGDGHRQNAAGKHVQSRKLIAVILPKMQAFQWNILFFHHFHISWKLPSGGKLRCWF